ncbi:MAG: hypothetical protein IPI85_09005 [Dehalococcoidia bacterium]|nr:hypothetical protein [Dehalococcoidia bacterium]
MPASPNPESTPRETPETGECVSPSQAARRTSRHGAARAQDRGERIQVLRVETVSDEDGRGFTGSQRDDRVDDCVEVDECRAFREGGRGQRTRHKYEHGAHRAGPPA